MNSVFDIILGMPVIKQLGVIEFDFIKNTMSFPKKTKTNNKRNLYIEGVLFMNMKICNEDFLSHFDTGSGSLSINTDFYEKHRLCISVESQVMQDRSGVGGCSEANLKHRYIYNCPQIEIEVNNRIITMINDCDVPKDKENDNVLGVFGNGVFGNAIFKYCKKATFDFVNMVFSVD